MTLDLIDIITTALFVIELILKLISFGLIVNGPWSYLRGIWNLMDFAIIIVSTISLFPTS